jgi:hypothetical protein
MRLSYPPERKTNVPPGPAGSARLASTDLKDATLMVSSEASAFPGLASLARIGP